MHNLLLKEKTMESLSSVLPITFIVLLLSVTIAPLEPGTMMLFLFGAFLLVLGMGFFTLGVEMSMTPMGTGIGVELNKSKKISLTLVLCFVLGFIITLAEPDLQVLAEQLPGIPNMTLILAVALGVGVFLVIAEIRMLLKIPLSRLLIGCYILVFGLAFFAPADFVPVAFDSGGVTTGPITVPFILALGVGMAAVRSDENSSSDSFGLVSLGSVGPILSVLLMGVFFQPEDAAFSIALVEQFDTTRLAAGEFAGSIPRYAAEVSLALLPIAGMFALFQFITKRFRPHQLWKGIVGLVYTYIGLVLFLTGVNVGFMPAGQVIGSTLAGSAQNWVLLPIGALVGYYIVRAEPAVAVLTKQVEEVSNGSISQKSILNCLSIGMAVSVSLAMLRILTGMHIMWLLIPGYLVALSLTFFVPQIFTGIAFDSGGVASGPMTTTFLLPLAMGACNAVGGNILTDAFGIVAMVAMTPLVTIQILGLVSSRRQQRQERHMAYRLQAEDCILYFDEEAA